MNIIYNLYCMCLILCRDLIKYIFTIKLTIWKKMSFSYINKYSIWFWIKPNLHICKIVYEIFIIFLTRSFNEKILWVVIEGWLVFFLILFLFSLWIIICITINNIVLYCSKNMSVNTFDCNNTILKCIYITYLYVYCVEQYEFLI